MSSFHVSFLTARCLNVQCIQHNRLIEFIRPQNAINFKKRSSYLWRNGNDPHLFRATGSQFPGKTACDLCRRDSLLCSIMSCACSFAIKTFENLLSRLKIKGIRAEVQLSWHLRSVCSFMCRCNWYFLDPVCLMSPGFVVISKNDCVSELPLAFYDPRLLWKCEWVPKTVLLSRPRWLYWKQS